MLKKLKTQLGLPKLNFQVLRRTIATLAQTKGSVKDVQGILGHSKADTTVNVYMQAIESGVKQQYPAIPVVMATAVHDILLLSFVFETELSITSLSLSSASSCWTSLTARSGT